MHRMRTLVTHPVVDLNQDLTVGHTHGGIVHLFSMPPTQVKAIEHDEQQDSNKAGISSGAAEGLTGALPLRAPTWS